MRSLSDAFQGSNNPVRIYLAHKYLISKVNTWQQQKNLSMKLRPLDYPMEN